MIVKLRNFLIASNLWVALAAGAFTLLSFTFFTTGMALSYSLLVAFATAAGYSYMRLIQGVQGARLQTSKARQWYNQHPVVSIALTFIYAFGSSLFFLIAVPAGIRWYLLPAVLVAGLYPIAFPNPMHSFSSLRNLPGLKLLIISACWVYITFIIPLLMQGIALGGEQIAEGFFRLLFVAAITIPFDVRDMPFDRPELKTLPQQIGARRAIIWACFGIGLYQFWLTVRLLFLNLESANYLGWMLGLELGYWLVKGVNKKRSDAYVSFWVEGIPLFILLLVIACGLLRQLF